MPCCFSDAAGVVSPSFSELFRVGIRRLCISRRPGKETERNTGGSSGGNSRVLVDTRCRYIDKVGVGSRKDKSVGRGRPIST